MIELSRILFSPISAIFSFDFSRLSRNCCEAEDTVLASFLVCVSLVFSTWFMMYRMAFLMSGSVSLEANRIRLAFDSSLRNSCLF